MKICSTNVIEEQIKLIYFANRCLARGTENRNEELQTTRKLAGIRSICQADASVAFRCVFALLRRVAVWLMGLQSHESHCF